MAELFANNAASTLDTSIDGSQTTLDVVSASTFPAGSGEFRIKIDDEIMIVTSVSTNTFTVTRAQEGTSGASHTAGVAVTHVLTAGAVEEIRYTDEKAEDAVGALLGDSATIDFTYNTNTSIVADVRYQMSLTSDTGGLMLVGDESSPGASEYYGTDGSGTRGFHTLPAGSEATTVSDTDTIDLALSGVDISGSVKYQMSITADATGIKLEGDESSPGNSQYYGTDGSGTKGFHALSGGGNVTGPGSVDNSGDNYEIALLDSTTTLVGSGYRVDASSFAISRAAANSPIVWAAPGTGPLFAIDGGDAPGQHSVDLTVGKASGTTRVPSGAYSCMIAGTDHIVAGSYSAIVAGYTNSVAGSYSATLGGSGHSVAGNYSAALGGGGAAVADDYAVAVGGNSLTISGDYSAGVGGYSNTSSGINCGLFVGNSNYIATGYRTVIIGGNGNTSSDGNDSGIIGGYNNQLDGNKCFIIGGDASEIDVGNTSMILSSAQSDLFNGNQSIIAGGYGNTITGGGSYTMFYSAIVGGVGNTIQGTIGGIGQCAIIGGTSIYLAELANDSVALGGISNLCHSPKTVMLGGEANFSPFTGVTVVSHNVVQGIKSYAPYYNATVHGNSGFAGVTGDAQFVRSVLRGTTINGSSADLYCNNTSGYGIPVEANTAITFRAKIVVLSADGDQGHWIINGSAYHDGFSLAITDQTTEYSFTSVGSNFVLPVVVDGGSPPQIYVTVDNVNTDEARWVATFEMTLVKFIEFGSSS